MEDNTPQVSVPTTSTAVGKPGSSATPWLLSAILALLLWTNVGRLPHLMPATWEYAIKSVPDTGFDDEMNKMGQDGWELVFARRASNGASESPSFSYEVIFKRPK